MRQALILTVGLAVVGLGAPASADVVVLKNDRVLNGRVEVVAGADGTPQRLIVHTATGKVSVAPGDVAIRAATPVELLRVFRKRRQPKGHTHHPRHHHQ